jgi:hypothetical protein
MQVSSKICFYDKSNNNKQDSSGAKRVCKKTVDSKRLNHNQL